MSRTQQRSPQAVTRPGQGNAGIAKLDPREDELNRTNAATPKAPAGPGPDIAADVKKHHQGHAKPEKSVEKNPVDEAAWESFPASDPPSTNPGTSTPGNT
ncbi:MAG: hypothetical protein QM775_07845 [Pirellulales bacterium]